jgi:hypothetical protein
MSLPRGDGRTAYQIAVRHGNVAIAQLLREHGASTDGLQPMEEFLGACLAADGDRARAMLAAHPTLIASMTAEDQSAMADAVNQGNDEAIRLMVDLGFQAVMARRRRRHAAACRRMAGQDRAREVADRSRRADQHPRRTIWQFATRLDRTRVRLPPRQRYGALRDRRHADRGRCGARRLDQQVGRAAGGHGKQAGRETSRRASPRRRPRVAATLVTEPSKGRSNLHTRNFMMRGEARRRAK